MYSVKDVFLLDANTLIEPSKKFYSFGIAPGFWQFMQREVFAGNLLVLDITQPSPEAVQ